MMASRNRAFVVGAFVVGTVVMLSVSLLWLGGSRFFRPVDRYRILFSDSISGLVPGAIVQFKGVPVGKVTDVALTGDSPPMVQVDIRIEPGTPVRRDSLASLTGSFITDVRSIEISGGSSGAGRLAPNGIIPVKPDSLKGVEEKAAQLANVSDELLASLNHDVLNPQNRAALSSLIQDSSATMHNLRALTVNLAAPERLKAIDATVNNLARASQEIDKVAARANRVLADASSRVDEVSGLAAPVAARLNRTLDDLDRAAVSASDLLDQNSVSLNQAVRGLVRTEQLVDEAVEEVGGNPSMIVWGTNTPKREERR